MSNIKAWAVWPLVWALANVWPLLAFGVVVMVTEWLPYPQASLWTSAFASLVGSGAVYAAVEKVRVLPMTNGKRRPVGHAAREMAGRVADRAGWPAGTRHP